MFSSETQSVIEVCVIENDVTMGVGLVCMNGKHILLYPFDIDNYRSLADELAFDYNQYTPGKRVYTFDQLLNSISDTEHLPVVEERDWVLRQFWGDYRSKADVKQLINNIRTI